MTSKRIISILSIVCLTLVTTLSYSKSSTSKKKSRTSVAKTEKSEDKTKETPYSKVFKGKKGVVTKKGFIVLHKIDDKIYMEVADSLIGSEVLLNCYVQGSSDIGVLYRGMQTAPAKRFVIDKTDSLVLFKSLPAINTIAEDAAIERALGISKMNPIRHAFPIIGVNKDTTATLLDCSNFFSIGNKDIVNLKGYSVSSGIRVYETEGNRDRSQVTGIESYANSMGVQYETSIKLKLVFELLGLALSEEPEISSELMITMTLLPKDKMKVRNADSRVGTKYLPFITYRSNGGTKYGNIVSRYSLTPSDTLELKKTGVTTPIKPIVFYVDTLFNKSWYNAIENGIKAWNDPLLQAGFKDAIKVLPFSADKTFNANDPLLNTIRFNAATSAAITSHTVTDPTTGEILGVSMYVPRDFAEYVRKVGLYDISNVDNRYTQYFLCESAVAEVLQAQIMRRMATVLGLTPNMSGANAYSESQLRDPDFTQKNGIASSVTDDVLFNKLAKKGDKERGVKLIIDKPGKYDYYAIKYLYAPILSDNEDSVLTSWIVEKEGQREYFYGKKGRSVLLQDPRSQMNDFGIDTYETVPATIDRLKFIINESAQWLKNDSIPTMYKDLFPDFAFLEFYDLVRGFASRLGGIYQNDIREGTTVDSYEIVPKAEQRKALKTMLQLCEDLSWMDNKSFVHIAGPNNNMSDLAYQSFPMMSIMLRVRNVAFTSDKAKDSYTVQECLNDVSDYVFKDIRNGAQLSKQHFYFAGQYVMSLISLSPKLSANYKANEYKSSTAISSSISSIDNFLQSYIDIEKRLAVYRSFHSTTEHEFDINAGGDMEAPNGIYYYIPSSFESVIAKKLKEAKSTLQYGLSFCKDEHMKEKYRFYISRIDRALTVRK